MKFWTAKRLLASFTIVLMLLISWTKPSWARLEEGTGGSGGGRLPIVIQELKDSCESGRINRGVWMLGCPGEPSIVNEILAASIFPVIGEQNKYNNLITYDRSGALFALSSMTSQLALNSLPVSSVYYMADLGKNLGLDLMPAVYAQSPKGSGFSAFYPVLGLWRAMANIAYGLMALVFLIVGFLIMFRSKLGAQTEITVQAALPRLVITMILIAFSYPIAGLMVDLMYTAIYAFIGFLSSSGLLDMNKALEVIFSSNPFTAIMGNGFITGVSKQLGEGASTSVTDLLGFGLGSLVSWLTNHFGSVLIWVIMIFFTLWIAFRIFITLLKAYAYILLLVALAPIYILANAIPGSRAFSSWIKNLASKLTTFPIIIFHLVVAAILVGAEGWGANPGGVGFQASQAELQGWSPPLFNFTFSSGPLQAVLALVSIGILYLAPQAAEMAEKLFQGQFGLDFTQAMGGAYQQAISPLQQAKASWDKRRQHERDKALINISREIEKAGQGG